MISRVPANLMLMLLAGISLCLPGCQWYRNFTNRDPFGPTAACRITESMDAQQLVQYLNERGPAKLHAWQADNVTITARGAMVIPVTVPATLAVEAPRNFRLRAGVLGGTDVDLGSNEERFWFWFKQSPQPNVFTARHDQLASAQQNFALPFQPDWIIEALGVIPIDEKEVILEPMTNAPRGRRWGKLISQRVSPQGAPVTKVILVDLCHGIILEHALYDARNNVIARAKLSDQHFEPGTGAVIPNRIDLDWPQTKMSLTLHLGPVQVNPQVSTQLFTLPKIPNCPVIDLGRTTAQTRPAARPHHQPVALTGALEDDGPLPSAPVFQPASGARTSRRESLVQEREELLE